MSDNSGQVDFALTGEPDQANLSECEVVHTWTPEAAVTSADDGGIPSREARMFDTIAAKWSEIGRTSPVVIPLDRPDLMADAGYDGLRYQGSGSHARVRRDWLAAAWMPFHAAAG